MRHFTGRELENLIDLVEIKLMCMIEADSPETDTMASLKACREKLFGLAATRSDVRVIPFDDTVLRTVH